MSVRTWRKVAFRQGLRGSVVWTAALLRNRKLELPSHVGADLTCSPSGPATLGIFQLVWNVMNNAPSKGLLAAHSGGRSPGSTVSGSSIGV